MHTTTHLAAEAMRSGASAQKVAHAALFERIMERIHRYFRRMVREPAEAQDCLQKTLTLLEESLVQGKYEQGRSFNTWMWLKARTVYAQWCRQRERQPALLSDGDQHVPEPHDPIAAKERQLDAATVLTAVQERLGDEVYEAFVLYYEGGLTQAEVAEAMGRDRKTIRNRIREAHTLIDTLLGT